MGLFDLNINLGEILNIHLGGTTNSGGTNNPPTNNPPVSNKITTTNSQTFMYSQPMSLMSFEEEPEIDAEQEYGLCGNFRVKVQTARPDVFVWGISTWTGYRWGGPLDEDAGTVEWLDLTTMSTSVRINRGTSSSGIQNTLEPGNVVVIVRDSIVDPNTNPYIKVGVPVVVEFRPYPDAYPDEWLPVFTGKIDNVQVQYYKDKKPTVTITAKDSVKDIANISRAGVDDDTYQDRFEDLLTKHNVPHYYVGAEDGPGVSLAANEKETSVLNHLQFANNSELGAFYVDRDNKVTFAPRAYLDNAENGSEPVVVFGDVHVTNQDAKENKFKNPSFKNAGQDWDLISTGNVPLVTETATDQVKYGNESLLLHCPASKTSQIANDQTIAISIGQSYSFGFWVRPGTTFSGTIQPFVYAYNENTSVYDLTTGTAVSLTAGQWTFVKLENYVCSITPDVDGQTQAFFGVFHVNGTASEHQFYVDGAILNKGVTVNDYFDGDSDGAYWIGESHLSESRLINARIHECYSDIKVEYDSDQLFNDISVTNITRVYNPDEADYEGVETKYGPYTNNTSVATWGSHRLDAELNLTSEAAVEDWAEYVLDRYASAEVSVKSITFKNTRMRHADIDIYSPVIVKFNTESVSINEKYRILSIEHEMHPVDGWIITIELQKIKFSGGN